VKDGSGAGSSNTISKGLVDAWVVVFPETVVRVLLNETAERILKTQRGGWRGCEPKTPGPVECIGGGFKDQGKYFEGRLRTGRPAVDMSLKASPPMRMGDRTK
jgi:hypothetical protein